MNKYEIVYASIPARFTVNAVDIQGAVFGQQGIVAQTFGSVLVREQLCYADIASVFQQRMFSTRGSRQTRFQARSAKEDMVEGGDSFGVRLNRLFMAQQSKTGVELSLSKFIEDFKDQTGIVLSKGYVSDLRNGLAPEPRLDLVRALARYFHVDPNYFLVSSPERAEEIAAHGELAESLQAAGATELGFRTAGLSAASIRHIAQIIDNVRSLEGLPPLGEGSGVSP